MRWSRIKKELEETLADSLKGNLKYHITVYTKDYSASKSANRAWITWEKKEILNISTEEFRLYNGYWYSKTTPTEYDLAKSEREIISRTEGKLIEKGEFSTYDFTSCACHFLNMNIEEALMHESPIINMFAILDKRVGKRKLIKLNEEKLHPLVNHFLKLRLQNEKIILSK